MFFLYKNKKKPRKIQKVLEEEGNEEKNYNPNEQPTGIPENQETETVIYPSGAIQTNTDEPVIYIHIYSNTHTQTHIWKKIFKKCQIILF